MSAQAPCQRPRTAKAPGSRGASHRHRRQPSSGSGCWLSRSHNAKRSWLQDFQLEPVNALTVVGVETHVGDTETVMPVGVVQHVEGTPSQSVIQPLRVVVVDLVELDLPLNDVGHALDGAIGGGCRVGIEVSQVLLLLSGALLQFSKALLLLVVPLRVGKQALPAGQRVAESLLERLLLRSQLLLEHLLDDRVA